MRFAVKSSKVLYDGSWPIDELDEELDQIEKIDKIYPVRKSVELQVIFSPANNAQAERIGDFLLTRAHTKVKVAITGSWGVPDVRASLNLSNALSKSGFKLARANIIKDGQGRLLILRQQSTIPQAVITSKLNINPELFNYLVSPGISP